MHIMNGTRSVVLAVSACAGFFFAAAPSSAFAQEIRLGEIRAHLYLESSGKLSDDVLVIKNPKLVNVPRGEGIFGEPSNTIVFNVGFLGAKNTQPKFATALVNITVTNRTGQRKTEARPILGLVFGEEGKVNRAIVLENVTCSKIEIEVKSKAVSKKANLEFECNDPKTADASDRTPAASGLKKR
jgi:hypothetical protein